MDYANETNFVVPDCAIASPISPSTQTCEDCTLNQEQSICSVPAHPVNRLPSKENVWEVVTSETVSEQSCKLLEEPNPNSFASKTCLDCYQPPLFPEPNPAHISNRCSGSFTPVGTMHNGVLSELPGLKLSGEEAACYLLPRPGALSWSGKGRPPGTTKSEAQAKKLGIIGKNEVFNPEWLEQEFGLPIGWTDPQECRAATELIALVEPPSEIFSTPDSLRSPSGESCTSIPSSNDTIEESPGCAVKAISLWQPWASLIPLGLKHYETRSWKTNYRGKLLICSTAANYKQHKEYLKICDKLQLPPWENFLHGRAIAICDLTDCIKMTAEFIAQQSQTEILCGDWQVGRYAWKLENIQPIAEPFAVKGKQGLFDIALENYEFFNEGEKGKGERENPEPETVLFQPPNPKHDEGKRREGNEKQSNQSQKSPKSKPSDRCYTPPYIVELIVQVLGTIDLDPCADDGKHVPAGIHYTVADDGLSKPWHGRIFFNPPYSCPGKWIAWFSQEYAAGRAIEAIALLPAATDTNWLSPILKAQPVCFWKGRIKFLDENYQPMRSGARQSHVFVYWGDNWERFKEVFDEYGVVQLPSFVFDKREDFCYEPALLKKVLEDSQFNSRETVLVDKAPFSLEKNLEPQSLQEITPYIEVISSSSSSLYRHLKGEDFCQECTPLEKFLEDSQFNSRETVLGDKAPFSLEKDLEPQSRQETTPYTEVISSSSGSLYRYLKNVKQKSGLTASYPRIDGVRDSDNVNHWYWGYNYKVAQQGEWKSKSLSVSRNKVCTVRLLIESNAPIVAIKDFIKAPEDSQSISREILDDKAPHSLEKFSASGSLYRYLKHKKLKSGAIASYPPVEGVRDPDNLSHWYWGYSYEVLENGKWKGRSLSVHKSKVLAVQGMINDRRSVCEIKAFIE